MEVGATDYLRFFLVLLFVLGLIGLFAVLARRAGLGFPAKAISPTGDRRLSVVEVTALDSRRRLVLVRRDDVEHLVILSPTAEVVVETGIRADNPGNFAAALESATTRDPETAP